MYMLLAPDSAAFDFQSNQYGLNDPKGNNTVICTVMNKLLEG